MSTIGKVKAVFSASTGGLVEPVDRSTAALARMDRALASVAATGKIVAAIEVGRVFTSLVSGAVGAARSLIGIGQGAAETIDQTSKLSRRLGLTYAELSGLAHAGDLAGVSMELIGKAATKADVAFVRAAQGSVIAKEAFSGLGLEIAGLQGMSAGDRFIAIAQRIADLPTAAERSAAAIRLFGKAGADLVPLFEAGGGAIREAYGEAFKFGAALSDAQGVAVENMNDAWSRVRASISGIVGQVVVRMAPAVQGIADTFTDLVGRIGGANIGTAIGDGILAGARSLAVVADGLAGRLGALFSDFGSAFSQMGSVVDVAYRVTGAVQGLIGALGTLFTAIPGIFSTDAKSFTDMVGITPQWLKDYQAGIRGNFFDSAAYSGAGFSAMAGGLKSSSGPAAGGTLTAALDRFIEQSRAVATGPSKSLPQTVPMEAASTRAVASIDGRNNSALKGVLADGVEGYSEMLRLMRGGGDDVAAAQLEAMQTIAANTDPRNAVREQAAVFEMGY